MNKRLVSNLGLCFSLAVLWTACGENTTKSASQASAKTSQTNKCYETFDYKYEELLSKQNIEKYIRIDESTFDLQVNHTHGQYGSATYKWDSDRPDQEIEFSGLTIPQPDNNYINVTQLKFYTKDDLTLYQQADVEDLFAQGYRALTQEDYKMYLGNLEKNYETNSKELENAKDLLEARMVSRYEQVEQLGDLAYWKWNELYGGELVVLHGNTSFRIDARLSSHPQETLDIAIQLAKEVIAKCQN